MAAAATLMTASSLPKLQWPETLSHPCKIPGSCSAGEATGKWSSRCSYGFHRLTHKFDNGDKHNPNAICWKIWVGPISKQEGYSRIEA
ncbi:hypothetical protein OIU74_025260 [Salix koriyanagi]|uniref:Uncharacterized protein n=1 Tax=Salix koriyanagi TaxID=2511006 RepID=A0A9Q0W1D1_9ROSI|nr:hypothetical protein OIU74_025260 [Salix koriyanagi]